MPLITSGADECIMVVLGEWCEVIKKMLSILPGNSVACKNAFSLGLLKTSEVNFLKIGMVVSML
jgi:hypothetical protein